jgi:serine protease inhibitor
MNAFGLELLGQVTAGASAAHTNVLLCPLSVAAALNMVAAGATEHSPCASQLDAALHLPASTHHTQLHGVLSTILQVGRFRDAADAHP